MTAEQKGMHLVHHALFHTLAQGGQFVLMGDAHCHDGIAGHFRQLKKYLNDNQDCHLEIGYREELAHLVYAGADLLVVPSMFEPCGLAPLIGMRYGTVPVVRATGGMIDTVFDRDHSGRPAAGWPESGGARTPVKHLLYGNQLRGGRRAGYRGSGQPGS